MGLSDRRLPQAERYEMNDFETRWQNAVRKTPWGQDEKAGQVLIATAFMNSTFIYGTVGPNALHNGWLATGNPVARAGLHWINRAREHPHSIFRNRLIRLYDPGPRTGALVKGGLQMMDMYYGMNNDLFRNRDVRIAQFVHNVMGFADRGVPFDPNVSGREAFFRAFKTRQEGWEKQGVTDAAYGQSATKEMSKIIREGIKRFGGKLIFEGKSVYGSGIFDPHARQGDTDLEAQELFQSMVWPLTPCVPFGEGTLEFQWGGRPATPTRAHFLSNWNWGGPMTHGPANRVNPTNARDPWRDYLKKVMGKRHGLRLIWHNFGNFPQNFPRLTQGNRALEEWEVSIMERAIARVSQSLHDTAAPPQVGAFNRTTWTGDPRPLGRR
jgi:hypothetical protein